MKGLLLKDAYTILKQCRSYMFIFVIANAIGLAFSQDGMFYSIYSCLIVSLLPTTLLSYDERDKWDVYAQSLPFSKARLVSSKYLIGLLGCIASLFIIILLKSIFQHSSLSVYFSLALTGSLVLMAPAIVLPFMFRFGVEKGRVLYTVLVVAICAAGGFVSSALSDSAIVAKISGNTLIMLIPLISLLLYAASWLISIKLYKSKEI